MTICYYTSSNVEIATFHITLESAIFSMERSSAFIRMLSQQRFGGSFYVATKSVGLNPLSNIFPEISHGSSRKSSGSVISCELKLFGKHVKTINTELIIIVLFLKFLNDTYIITRYKRIKEDIFTKKSSRQLVLCDSFR